jgi:hypothetical protein
MVRCLGFRIQKFGEERPLRVGTEIWGGDLENSHWEVSKKDMRMHMMSNVKVCPSTTCHSLLAGFGGLPIELYACKLVMGFD